MPIVAFQDHWLELSFPVTMDQSEFINIGQESIVSPKTDSRMSNVCVRNERLKWVMLFSLAQHSDMMHSALTWELYLARIRPRIEDFSHHRNMVGNTMATDCGRASCFICSSQVFDELNWHETFDDLNWHGTDMHTYRNKPCPKGSCWECLCRNFAHVERCDRNCRCIREQVNRQDDNHHNLKQSRCHKYCSECNCTRKVYTRWLRTILYEDELVWDNWYDVLVERYGVREKMLRPSKF